MVNDAFELVKMSLTSSPTLSFFDLSRVTRLCSADASHQGLGLVLQQLVGKSWALVQAGSC
jgi:hypothetical protein